MREISRFQVTGVVMMSWAGVGAGTANSVRMSSGQQHLRINFKIENGQFQGFQIRNSRFEVSDWSALSFRTSNLNPRNLPLSNFRFYFLPYVFARYSTRTGASLSLRVAPLA